MIPKSTQQRSTVQSYRDKRRAERATALRSLNAFRRGQCCQFELRQLGPNGFVGGLCGELAAQFPGKAIVAQWSAGYRVQGGDA
jgi:hypothetical protein